MTFKLFANGVDTGKTKAEQRNHWHYEFSGLDTYDEDAAINYTVKEIAGREVHSQIKTVMICK